MKGYASPLAVACLVATLLVTALGFVLVPAGAMLPIHWGISGEADGFAPREIALFMPPLALFALWAIVFAIARFAPARETERGRAMTRAALTMTSALFLCIAVVIVLIGAGVAANMVQAIAVGIGLLLIVLGNAMPKSQPNSFAGLRTRATLSDPANWHATHRFTGLLCIAGGAILVVAALLVPVSHLFWWLLACVLIPMIAGLVYSFTYKK